MKVKAYIIAIGDENKLFKLQTSPILGISNIERIIITLKNSEFISEIYVISNIQELFKFISRFKVNNIKIEKSISENKNSSKDIFSLIDFHNPSKDILILNSKYPFISKYEIDKVLGISEQNFDVAYSSISKNREGFLINSIINNNKNTSEIDNFIDLESLYFIKNYRNFHNNYPIKKNVCLPVNIDWSYPVYLKSESDLVKARRLLRAINFEESEQINTKNLKFIFLDFDGVLTDNYLFSDKFGNEIIRTSKYDSYSIVRLKKELNILTYIITSELSETHKKRAEKIDIPIVQSKSPKYIIVKEILAKHGINYENKDSNYPKTIFIGNDVNDLCVIPFIDLFCCPSDAHNDVLSKADYILETRGGDGIVMELLKILKKDQEKTY